jgi:hypothetical protein
MSDLITIHDGIIAAFNTDWSDTVVAWPNLQFDPTGQTEFVRISVIMADSDRKSMGGSTNVFRQFGLVLIEIYTDRNGGARRSVELADLAIIFIHGLALTDVTFEAPNTEHIGIIESWFQKNVSCTFYSDNLF